MADAIDDATERNAAPGADPLWDDWETPPLVPTSPVLRLSGFDGPMDLLLDLVERQRIDLGRISILQLTEQFVAALQRLERHVAIERRADWLVIATHLLLWYSRLLFPASPAVEAEAAREAGREIERLDQLAFVRVAAAWLGGRPQLGHEVFARPQGRSPKVASYMALMEACLTVLRGGEGQPGAEEPVYRPPMTALWRVADALARMQALLVKWPDGAEFGRFLPPVPADDPKRELKARAAVASSFVAVLELTRQGIADVTQVGYHGSIQVRPQRPPCSKTSPTGPGC